MTDDEGPMTGDWLTPDGRRSSVTGRPPQPSPSPLPSSSIPGVRVDVLSRYEDTRGWLTELFRSDVLEAAGLKEAQPTMAYLSMTRPGVARGPHEHREQTDIFAFVGPSDFELVLWDNRQSSPTYGRRESYVLGASCPATVVAPPGVVHAYRNVGEEGGWVLNFANRLYKGPGRKEPVDEIRYEEDPTSPYGLEGRGTGRGREEGKGEGRGKDGG